jgi:hypothetical protein
MEESRASTKLRGDLHFQGGGSIRVDGTTVSGEADQFMDVVVMAKHLVDAEEVGAMVAQPLRVLNIDIHHFSRALENSYLELSLRINESSAHANHATDDDALLHGRPGSPPRDTESCRSCRRQTSRCLRRVGRAVGRSRSGGLRR